MASVVAFAICALVVGYFGSRLAALADQLADRTGVGEALMGGVVLGAVTSLSGSVLSVAAAFNDQPELALGNALGGMAAQMLFLVVADICYRKANLEHAAASMENIMQGALLVCLLSLLMLATYSPEWTIWNVHLGTPLMITVYIGGMILVNRSKRDPMWKPVRTEETRTDDEEQENTKLNLKHLLVKFSILAGLLGLTGWTMQSSASGIVEHGGLEAAVVGVLLTSVATSLPELVTSVAAVRRGALTLAVSGILGGNAYDSLFAAFADVAYRSGSIYHTITPELSFWVAVNLAMSGVLILGLLLREKRGVGSIGIESLSVGVLYILGVLVLLLGGDSVSAK